MKPQFSRRRRRLAVVGAALLYKDITAFTPIAENFRSPSCTALGVDNQSRLRSATARGAPKNNIPFLPNRSAHSADTPKTLLKENDSKGNSMGMTVMSAAGLAISVGVIYTLSMSNDPVPLYSPEAYGSGQGLEILEESLETAGRNVLKASLPQTASDVVSVALGEAIAGVVGAGASLLVSLILRVQAENEKLKMQKKDMVREAVADGDYFMTQAAALPLFEAFGLPPFLASVTSVLVAVVPYEFIKLGMRSDRARREEEDLLMEQLLEEERQKRRRQQGIFGMMKSGSGDNAVEALAVDPLSLIPVQEKPNIDFVELFADTTRWLEYDVLKDDLSGRLAWNGQKLASNVDSAIFGFLAAMSSQLYADLIYRFTDYGTEERRRESRERSLSGWIRLYSTICFNSAALFGVYESVKAPVGRAVAGLLTGGVENCIGSEDYNLCLDAYVKSNPPGEADFAAQIRSLATALVSLWQRLQTDGSFDREEFTRSVLVQLYSLGQQIFSFTLFATEISPSDGYLQM